MKKPFRDSRQGDRPMKSSLSKRPAGGSAITSGNPFYSGGLLRYCLAAIMVSIFAARTF